MMNTFLLYPDRDWKGQVSYDNPNDIIKDLDLNILCSVAAKHINRDGMNISSLSEKDTYLESIFRRILIVPLETEEEILYRQEALKDVLEHPEFANSLYGFVCRTLTDWEKAGRHASEKNRSSKEETSIVTRIHIISLFAERLSELKKIFRDNASCLNSKAFKSLAKRLEAEYPLEFEQKVNKILNDVSFLASADEEARTWGQKKYLKPSISLQVELTEGFKFDKTLIQNVESTRGRFRRSNPIKHFIREYFRFFLPKSLDTQSEVAVTKESAAVKTAVVKYVINSLEPFMKNFAFFFDQLKTQLGFYIAAENLKEQLNRYELSYCFPTVASPHESQKYSETDIEFTNLCELAMAIEQHCKPVTNSNCISGSNLLIVTGANQGGKSTFLRSIGIAQVMMQAGLFVPAESYKSGIYPSLFTHFTRREDSEMNSGRLDEELKRMSDIIDNLGEHSLILLNESFATTTEREGSNIAYDIIRALTENDVKVLTVTHLLSFACKAYEEKETIFPHSMFLSAERTSSGIRTYKMVPHEPELTSFGLDLYKAIIG